MRVFRTRTGDATFELNLAPFLDIIVSIVPMLLLSIAFVQIKMIESPVPQVVSQEQAKNQPQKLGPSISLHVSKKAGFVFDIADGNKSKQMKVELKNGAFDFDGLVDSAMKVKQIYPDIFKLSLMPEGDIAFDDIVKVMDQVRNKPKNNMQKISFTDTNAGKIVETDLIFPDIVFSNVGG